VDDKQARELAELRAFLTARALSVEVCEKDGDAMHVRVPADQEARLREAMAERTRTRTALFFKRGPRPQQPPAGEG
jgi:hypothetical protein